MKLKTRTVTSIRAKQKKITQQDRTKYLKMIDALPQGQVQKYQVKSEEKSPDIMLTKIPQNSCEDLFYTQQKLE